MNLNRPQTLEIGKLYLHREHPMIRKSSVSALVKFSSYTACPAFVIVQSNSGIKIRCPRDDLFTINGSDFILGSLVFATLFKYLKLASVFFRSLFPFFGVLFPDRTLLTTRAYREQHYPPY